MAGATLTTLATAIKKNFSRMVETENTVRTPLRDLLKRVPSLSGNSWDWKVHYGGNASSTTYNEGDGVSAAGNETYADATVANTGGYARTMCQITGHAIDAMKGGYFDGVEKELTSGIQKHMRYKEGLAVVAMEAAIDSAGNYGGLSRATYKLESYESTSTPTLAELQLMTQTLMDNEPAVDMTQAYYLMAMDTMFDYLDVATGVAYFEFPSVVNGVVDAGKLLKSPTYNGRPIYPVPGLTSGITLCLTPEADVKLVEFRPLQIDILGKTDDSIVTSITSCEILVAENPRKAGKLT
jgi:hypothetical protein